MLKVKQVILKKIRNTTENRISANRVAGYEMWWELDVVPNLRRWKPYGLFIDGVLRVVGVLGLYKNGLDCKISPEFKKYPHIYLACLVVEKSFQRRGLGTIFLQSLAQTENILLSCNVNTLPFYHKNKFECVGKEDLGSQGCMYFMFKPKHGESTNGTV